jgi:maltose alpha-D-glucosyltransferase / alpha-amylase
LGSRAADQARLIGIRTGEMHLALAEAGKNTDFSPEPFSLHYQRSLYSAMVSLVREVFQNLKRNLSRLSPELQPEIEELLTHREEILEVLKKIYAKKLDVEKIRIHGNYSLSQILLTGKDVSIHGYGGDVMRPYSESRLKRSPLRDVATMLRSFHNAAYDGFFVNHHKPTENSKQFVSLAQTWAFYMGSFFMKAYLDTVTGTHFVPKEKEDFRVMLQTFLVEKALLSINKALNEGSSNIVVPLRTIQAIIKS